MTQLQELRGNIRVFARCRRDDRVQCALTFPSEEDICITDSKNQKRLFRFDRVYDPDTTQEEVSRSLCASHNCNLYLCHDNDLVGKKLL